MTPESQAREILEKHFSGGEQEKEAVFRIWIPILKEALLEYGEEMKGKCPIHKINRGIVCTVCVVETVDAKGFTRGRRYERELQRGQGDGE